LRFLIDHQGDNDRLVEINGKLRGRMSSPLLPVQLLTIMFS
jgi:hypothetical protein